MNLSLITDESALILRAQSRKADAKDHAEIGTALKEYVQEPTNVAAGLAAPQVGIDLSICAVKLKTGVVTVMYNPVIVWRHAIKVKAVEGCLSLPGQRYEVERSAKITVSFQNERGQKMLKPYEGWDARVVQHEIDHLNGVLISDIGTSAEAAA